MFSFFSILYAYRYCLHFEIVNSEKKNSDVNDSMDHRTGIHAKLCLPLLIQVLQIIFVVFFLDTSGHSINTSDMYPIPNTLEYGNRTYKIINENMTWYTALKTCLMHGAELVSITDQYHQSFLTVILNRLGHAHWIGLFTEDVGVLKSLGQSLHN